MRRKELKALLDKYIAEHFTGYERISHRRSQERFYSSPKSDSPRAMGFIVPQPLRAYSDESFDFDKIFEQNSGETFSEMLLRLVKESGKKPSEIYNRADIDRQTFSKIKLNKDYQPDKDTAVAFAIALKLDLPTTKKLLETAGYALSNATKRDIIISFFIESEIFSVIKLNCALLEYKQKVLFNRE